MPEYRKPTCITPNVPVKVSRRYALDEAKTEVISDARILR